jgi:tRNA/rRNA methyltransferase
LFGRERWGLLNEEVALADAIVTFPVEPAFASLNIAQAVLLMAYEWRRQFGTRPTPCPLAGEWNRCRAARGTGRPVRASGDDAGPDGFFTTDDKKSDHGQQSARPPSAVRNFSSQEIRTLRGVISSIDRHERPNPAAEDGWQKSPNRRKAQNGGPFDC